MMQRLHRGWGAGAALALALLAGCGGGGGAPLVAAPPQDDTRGSVRLEIHWPGSGRGPGLPLGTRSVRVTLLDGNVTQPIAPLEPERIVIGPAAGLGTSTSVEFINVRPGPVRVTASAHPDAEAAQAAIAVGNGSGDVVVGQTARIGVPMAETATRIEMSSPTLALIVFTPVVQTATVFDAQNRPLRYPLVWISSDPNIVEANVNPDNPSQATLFPRNPGTATVTAREPNTGLTATSAITVSPIDIGG